MPAKPRASSPADTYEALYDHYIVALIQIGTSKCRGTRQLLVGRNRPLRGPFAILQRDVPELAVFAFDVEGEVFAVSVDADRSSPQILTMHLVWCALL